MDSLFVLRERIREVYAKHSKVIDKVIQFILALVTFYLINSNVGFMKVAATPVVMLALAIICTFFPLTMTIIAATVLILAHMFAVSLGALIVTAGVFLVMYIFYFRLTPKMALVVLLTPIAFAFKVPYILPIAYGLIGTPIAMVAVGCGTIVFYMMEYVKKASAGMNGKDAPGLMGQISAYLKQVFQNKEMWIVIVAFIICMLVVYAVRRMSVNHAWKVAIVAGAVVNIVLNMVLIPSFGSNGAAVATFISYFVMFFSRLLHTRKWIKIRINAVSFCLNFAIVLLQCLLILAELPYYLVYQCLLFGLVLMLNARRVLAALSDFGLFRRR